MACTSAEEPVTEGPDLDTLQGNYSVECCVTKYSGPLITSAVDTSYLKFNFPVNVSVNDGLITLRFSQSNDPILPELNFNISTTRELSLLNGHNLYLNLLGSPGFRKRSKGTPDFLLYGENPGVFNRASFMDIDLVSTNQDRVIRVSLVGWK